MDLGEVDIAQVVGVVGIDDLISGPLETLNLDGLAWSDGLGAGHVGVPAVVKLRLLATWPG